MALATTKMLSRGQVVIPEEIRLKLKLKEGSRFIVVEEGDTVLFKVLPEPSREEFQKVLEKFRLQVKEAGLKKSDLSRPVTSPVFEVV
ncbi:MAG: AbrB/MazE/SpoVT family DNA-binding domain-containing protein [Proteobacteria bacterium]|nr:AbrB/MazE/SpoVT family DNA-binding domain-containing protein [Pseudomonadota bacterium]